jgi:glycine/D-amino acid oxidase-like deaminating enzyme
MLEGIKFTRTWGGPVGMPRDWMPAVAFDPATRIGFARGYTGQSVSTTNLAGRVLAGLIAGRPSGSRPCRLPRDNPQIGSENHCVGS